MQDYTLSINIATNCTDLQHSRLSAFTSLFNLLSAHGPCEVCDERPWTLTQTTETNTARLWDHDLIRLKKRFNLGLPENKAPQTFKWLQLGVNPRFAGTKHVVMSKSWHNLPAIVLQPGCEKLSNPS
jgi:hypothetical protein